MSRVLATTIALVTMAAGAAAHNFGATITWNREISRLVYDRCASCHRAGGTSFPLMAYTDVQPRAVAIKQAVLSRQMPPWGAVKGFGSFRDDQGLTQEQIELMTRWVDDGTPRGNNPRLLPREPTFEKTPSFTRPANAIPVSGEQTLKEALALEGLLPERMPAGASIQVVASLPDGSIQPLIWLYQYQERHRHPFLFRRVVQLPQGTVIRGVPPDAVLVLLPAQK